MKTENTLKPVGPWDVKRRIRISSLLNAADVLAVERSISGLAGVGKVAVDLSRQRVIVRYDASQLSYHQIASVLEGVGFPPLDNWWSRVKGNWYQFSDINARDNAKAPPPACCNKPPK